MTCCDTMNILPCRGLVGGGPGLPENPNISIACAGASYIIHDNETTMTKLQSFLDKNREGKKRIAIDAHTRSENLNQYFEENVRGRIALKGP